MYIFKEERDGNIFKVGNLIEALIQVFSKIFIYPMIIPDKKTTFKAVFTCIYLALCFARVEIVIHI